MKKYFFHGALACALISYSAVLADLTLTSFVFAFLMLFLLAASERKGKCKRNNFANWFLIRNFVALNLYRYYSKALGFVKKPFFLRVKNTA